MEYTQLTCIGVINVTETKVKNCCSLDRFENVVIITIRTDLCLQQD